MSHHLVRRAGAAIVFLGLSAPLAAQELNAIWSLEGFAMPESVIYDAANARLIVTNMAGFGAEAGEDGYLSLVSIDGTLLEEQWATGLQDPRGMAIVGDTLYVADNPGIRVISLADGTLLETIALEGAAFPNDISADAEDALYVSDTFGQTIYRYADGTAEPWFGPDAALPYPNGVFVDNGRLIVGSMGDGMGQAFDFEIPGGLIAIDIASGEASPIAGAQELGGIDGVGASGEWIVFNDNFGGAVFAWREGEDAIEIGNAGAGGADLWVEDDMVYVPNLMGGSLTAYRLE